MGSRSQPATSDRPVAASIDIGTNTVRLLVVRISGPGPVERVYDDGRMTGLGDALTAEGTLAGPAAERTLAAIEDYAAVAREVGADPIVPYATASVRRASRAEAFLEEASGRAVAQVKVLSGDEEARMSYLGVAFTRAHDDCAMVVADVGGGSIELSWGVGADYLGGASVPVGSRLLAARHGTSSPEQVLQSATLREALRAVCRELEPLCTGPERPGCDVLVGTGGTITALVAIELGLSQYECERVQGTQLSRAELGRLVWRLAQATLDERRAICHLEPERAEVIVHGGMAFVAIMDLLNNKTVEADVNGIRLGVLVDVIGMAGA